MVTLLSMVLIGIDTKNQGGAGFMQVVNSEHSWVQRDYSNTAALNLAEAGLEAALDDIAKSWSSGSGYTKTETLATGTYTVQTIASTSSTYTLEAAGTVSQLDTSISRAIQLKVNKGTGGASGPYAILSGGNTNLKKSSTAIYSAPSTALHSNGNFEFDGSLAVYTVNQYGQAVYAGITASGNIKAKGSLASSGTTENAPTVSLPTADYTQLKSEAATVINGNYDVEGGSIGASNAVTYITGNLDLEGNVTAQGTIVVEGNVDIEGTVKPPSGGSLEIISKGNVDFDDDGASSASAELVANVYCEGNFKLRPGSPWIKGKVIASGNIEFTDANAGSLRIDYSANAASQLTSGSGTPTVEDWKEVY